MSAAASSTAAAPQPVTEALTSDGLVRKTITTSGEGEPAGRGAKAQIRYTLHLPETRSHTDKTPTATAVTSPPSHTPPPSTIIDSSSNLPRQQLTFTIGRRKVIPALDLAAHSMRKGEHCTVHAAAPYAFGKAGLRRKNVPPDADVVLHVEMVDFEGGEKHKSLAEMTPMERFQRAKMCKEEGNALFKEIKYEKAVVQYSQCIRYLANLYYGRASASANGAASDVKKKKKKKEVTTTTTTVDGGGNSVDQSAKTEEKTDGFSEAVVVENGDHDGDEDAVETVDVTSGIAVSNGVAATEVKENENENGAGATSDGVAADAQTNGAAHDDNEQQQHTGGETENSVEVVTEQKEEEEEQEEEEEEKPEGDEVKALHVTALNNLSLCFLKMEQNKQAVESATLALEIEPNSFKAFYYRGRAQVVLGEWEKARSDLTAASKQQPTNVGIKMELAKLNKKMKSFENRERKQAAAMFA